MLAQLIERLEGYSTAVTRYSLPLLRVSLGVVYIWFGALKLSDSTPVAELIGKTVPFIPEHIFVPALGAMEVVVGLGLVIGRQLGLIALFMMGHLAGTFLVLIELPGESFQNGNPLLLTMTGEFVMKNVVLITAGLVLITHARATVRRLALTDPPVGDAEPEPAPGLVGAVEPAPALIDAVEPQMAEGI